MRRGIQAPRFLLRFLIVLALGVFASAVPGGAWAEPEPPGVVHQELPLTVPPPPSVPNFGTTTTPDGTPIAVIVAGGDGGKLTVVNLNTGKSAPPLDFAKPGVDVQPWAFATLSDASVLIGAGTGLYRYDPSLSGAEAITSLSNADVRGYRDVERHIGQVWGIAVDDRDNAYIATYDSDGGSVLTYHPSRGWGALPGAAPVDAQAKHARSVSYDGGKLYVSVGENEPALYEFDLGTGAKRNLGLPKAGMTPYLEVHGGVVYAGNETTGTMVYDMATGASRQWRDVIGRVVTRPGESRKVYAVTTASQLVEYDPATGARTPMVTDSSLIRRLSPNSWATRDTFVSVEMNGGRLSIYRAGQPRSTLYSGLVAPSPRVLQSLVAADNGKLYGSWYMVSPNLLAVTPAATVTDTSSELIPAPSGQGEAMLAHGERLITGLYQGARIGRHSTADHAAFDANPPAIGGQDRPYSLAHVEGNLFAVGSVPRGGHLGGALSFYNADTRAITTHSFKSLPHATGVAVHELVDQAPISLAHRNGKLYIGTTIRGGVGDRAREPGGALQEARLLEFDVAKGVVTRVVNPFPGEGQRAINSLVFGDDGTLYGTTGTYVFRVDLATLAATKHTVKDRGRVLSRSWDANRTWTVHHKGTLYTVLGGSLCAIETANLSDGKVLAPGDSRGEIGTLTLARDGWLYYTRGSRIYRTDHPTRAAG